MKNKFYAHLFKKKYARYYFFTLIAIVAMASITYYCKQIHQNKKKLCKAEQLVEESPEQALSLLENLKTGLLNEEQYAWFIILEARTCDLLNKPIPSDSAVFNARDYFKEKPNPAKASVACFVAACTHENQDRYVDAIYNYQQADDWAEKENCNITHFFYSFIPYNLSRLYCMNDNFNESIIYAEKALKYIGKENGGDKSKLYPLEIMGLSYKELNKPDSAICYYNEALKISSSLNDTISKRRVLDNLAKLYLTANDFPQAKKYCSQSLELTKPEDKSDLGQIYITLSSIYLKNNQLDSASIAAYKANDLITESDIRLRMYLYEYLTRIEEKKGDLNKANEYNQLHESYKKIRNSETLRVQELINLQKNNYNTLLNREDINRKLIHEFQGYFYLGGCVFALCLGLLFYLLLRISKTDKVYSVEFNRKVQECANTIDKKLRLEASRAEKQLKRDMVEYKVLLREENDKQKSKMSTFQKKVEAEFEEIYRAARIEIVKSIFQCRDLANLLEYTENEFPNDEKANLLIEIMQDMQNKVTWEEMYPLFNIQYNNLFIELRIDFPMLNEKEYRVCCLRCAQFTNDEIAGILRISVEKVEELKKSIDKHLTNAGFNQTLLDSYTKKIAENKLNLDFDLN